jgi:S-DNA-T family DNA segregation ATPase FtsK/SpoIIIE
MRRTSWTVLRLRTGAPGEAPVERQVRPDATVADLARSLGHDPAGGLVVDGRRVRPDDLLDEAGVCQGSVLAPVPVPEGGREHARAGATLVVADGLDAGHRYVLGPGTNLIGRSPACAVVLDEDGVEPLHATVEVDPSGRIAVTALGDAPAPMHDATAERITIGRRTLLTEPTGTVDRPSRVDPVLDRTDRATVVFNRPPRLSSPEPVRPLDLPAAPSEIAPQPAPVATIVVPLALAAVLVAVTRNWLYAGLTALSPVLAGTSWWSSRRAARRAGRMAAAAHAGALDRLADGLAAARDRDDRALARRAVPPVEAARWIRTPSLSLWSRRPGERDAFTVTLGVAGLPWRPDTATAPWYGAAPLEQAVHERCTQVGAPRRRPVVLDLADRRVIGIVGPTDTARAVARSMVVQLVAQHGPADLATLVVAAPGTDDAWSWTRWLPHDLDPGAPAGPSPSAGPDGEDPRSRGARAIAGELMRRTGSGRTERSPASRTRTILLVIDDPSVFSRPDDPVRRLLRGDGGPVLAVVLASDADRLPASCRAVLEVEAGGTGRLRSAADGDRLPDAPGTGVVDAIALDGISTATADELAATLARYEDPELDRPEAALPSTVGLLELLDEATIIGSDAAGAPGTLHTDHPSGHTSDDGGTDGGDGSGDAALARAILARWQAAGIAPAERLAVPIGIGTGDGGVPGPVVVDLLRDGPHGLVAGTTGSGKSELLRAWIAGLAASCPPELLHLVLIDFKGGSAFDAAADLPHTVAVVTDLDGELAERALRALHAELRRRERILREAGAADLGDLLGRPGTAASPVLARLVVVIDEFAGLAAELPSFLESLVGIAQRGRSLGVHLVLATQRPTGIVSDQIRANTNIRIALRVQDSHDALDVVGVADPAGLDRRQAGRAYVRLGRGDVTVVQTAFAGTVEPLCRPGPVRSPEPEGHPGRSDLERLVAACRLAARWTASPAPRRPWPPPLPERITPVDLADLTDPDPSAEGLGPPGTESLVPFLVVDDPDHQCRRIGGWDPDHGNLAVIGCRGSGTTSALVAVLHAAFGRWGPDDLHAYVIGDDPCLSSLDKPHVGAVVRPSDSERRTRLLALLDAELAARRHGAASGGADGHGAGPRIVLAVDNLGSLRAALDGGGIVGEDAERLDRLVTDGPAQGLWCVVTAEHPAALPHRLASAFTQRLVLRLADPLDARSLGTAPVHGPPGRGRLAACGRLVQVVDPAGPWPVHHGAAAGPTRRPFPVPVLPDRVTARELAADAGAGTGRTDDGSLPVLIGVGGLAVRPCLWTLRPGEGALVAGPPRSGRSTVLATLAAGLVGRATVVAVAPRPSPLAAVPGLHTVAEALTPGLLAVADDIGPGTGDGRGSHRVLLVDDADLVEDPAGVVGGALAAGWVVVAAGRADALRSTFGHWTRTLRTGRTGVLLRPDRDLDGDLLGVRLPRRTEAPLDRPGRGYLVDEGIVSQIQCVAHE